MTPRPDHHGNLLAALNDAPETRISTRDQRIDQVWDHHTQMVRFTSYRPTTGRAAA